MVIALCAHCRGSIQYSHTTQGWTDALGMTKPPMSIMVSSDRDPQALATTRSRDSAPMALKRQMAMLCTRKSSSQYTKNLQASPARRLSWWTCCTAMVPHFCVLQGNKLCCGTLGNDELSRHCETMQHNVSMCHEAMKHASAWQTCFLSYTKAQPWQDTCQARARPDSLPYL